MASRRTLIPRILFCLSLALGQFVTAEEVCARVSKLDAAMHHLKGKDYAAAHELLSAILEESPEDIDALYLLGRCFGAQENHTEAFESYKRFLAEYGGRLQRNKHWKAKHQDVLKRLLADTELAVMARHDPLVQSARQEILLERAMDQAQLKRDERRFSDAITVLRAVVRRYQGKTKAVVALSIIAEIYHQEMRQLDSAIEIYDLIAREYAFEQKLASRANLALAEIFLARRKRHDAMRAFHRVAHEFAGLRNGTVSAKAAMKLAQLQVDTDQLIAALTTYRDVVKRLPHAGKGRYAALSLLAAGDLARDKLHDKAAAAGLYRKVVRDFAGATKGKWALEA